MPEQSDFNIVVAFWGTERILWVLRGPSGTAGLDQLSLHHDDRLQLRHTEESYANFMCIEHGKLHCLQHGLKSGVHHEHGHGFARELGARIFPMPNNLASRRKMRFRLNPRSEASKTRV